MWITYCADKSKPGVMIACPGVSGANGLAAASSWGPAALWIMPEMPLPASKDGLAEMTRTSLCTVRIEHFTILSIKPFTFALPNDMF